ncbi:hypothetical protein FOB72_19370 [Cupriavidus pauculus]|uniref:Uncharacterized protein n=1 Tax=Cupriavidus pauculus TaxID=82633 RepID=A0A5P2HA42_9BURK|nr:hypothetical protein [Cupriavidus pauculus]QET04305.1 hypothetical protein FOB72_19370 [Cupriavidus pauculus]
MKNPDARKKIYKKFLVGYLGLAGMILFALGFSLAQGASWRPVIVGAPVYLTFFLGLTYSFIKEIRAQGRKERGKPEPPPRKSPWEEE